MTTIVMNTLNGAVTEYDWAFQSITPTHAVDALGLYTLGGADDNEVAIAASFKTGKQLWGSVLRKFIDAVHFSILGSGAGALLVDTPTASYSYAFTVAATGMSRAQPGRGIRENYLAFGYQNTAGADFVLDRMEIPVAQSSTRRV